MASTSVFAHKTRSLMASRELGHVGFTRPSISGHPPKGLSEAVTSECASNIHSLNSELSQRKQSI